MASFRVPYPSDPERRRAIFDRLAAKLGGLGRYQGTPDEGMFEGSVPVIGTIAGRYRSPAGADQIEVEITKKPFLISMGMIESQARKVMAEMMA